MEENIQDAESTIRDTDVADEMMAYTKNNILIQSAQAMLAQANQVPRVCCSCCSKHLAQLFFHSNHSNHRGPGVSRPLFLS